MSREQLRQLSDGSLDIGSGIIGPSTKDQDWANKLVESPSLASSASEKAETKHISEKFPNIASSIIKKLPPPMRWGLRFGMPALALSLFAAACEGARDSDSEGPSTVVEEFYKRLEKFDTAGMIELACPEVRQEIESGLGLPQGIIGFGGLFGINVDELELADFEARTISLEGDEATVKVTGRLLAGPPIGSMALDDLVRLRRAEGQWCLIDSTDSASVAESRQTPSPKLEVAPTVESLNERGLIEIDKWLLAIQKWEESPFKYVHSNMYGEPENQYKEGWKYVNVSGRLRNVNSGLFNNGVLSQGREKYSIQFRGSVGGSTFEYRPDSSIELDPIKFQVPEGFSYGIGFTAWVPNTVDNYSLVITDKRTGQELGSIEKDTVIESFDEIIPSVDLKAVNDEWLIPGYAQVKFTGTHVDQFQRRNSQFDVEWIAENQFITFDIKNLYGQDIPVSYQTDFKALVFLPDGGVVGSGDIGYGNKIAPGLTKTYDLEIGRTYNAGNFSNVDIRGNIYPTQGAIVVAIVNNQWVAWQLP